MMYPIDDKSNQEIKNYCHAFGEFKVHDWASWKAYSEVSLKMILEENKENYYDVLQFAKHLFYGYVHSLLRYKIEEINKHPAEFIKKAVDREKESLINYFYSSKLNNDSYLIQEQILELIKNPFCVHYPIEYYDINDSSCLAEAIANRNFLHYIEQYLSFGLKNKKLFSEIVHNEEIEILIAFIEKEIPVYTLDQFHLHIQELSFNAFESLSSHLNYLSSEIRSEYVRHYFEAIDKIRSELKLESENGSSALTEIMSKLQIQPFTSIDERQYRNVFMEIDKIEYKPSLDEELQLLSSFPKTPSNLLEVKKALAYIYISNLWEMLNNKKQKDSDSEPPKHSTLPCTLTKSDLEKFINELSQYKEKNEKTQKQDNSKQIHFVKDNHDERQKLASIIVGESDESVTIIFNGGEAFTILLFVISMNKEVILKIPPETENLITFLENIDYKKYNAVFTVLKNFFHTQVNFISPDKVKKRKPCIMIRDDNLEKNVGTLKKKIKKQPYNTNETILKVYKQLFLEKAEK